MLRALLAAALLLVAAPEDTAKLMVPAPAGFEVLAAPTGVNGPLTADTLSRLAGDEAVKGIPAKDLRAALADSYAKTFVHQANRDALVMFAYHLRSDNEAAGFVKGALNSAAGDTHFTRQADPAEGVALFTVDDPTRNTKGQMTLLRQGRYVFQFLLLGAVPEADKDIAKSLALAQRKALPPGSHDFAPKAGSANWLVLGLLAVLVAAVVFGLSRLRRKPTPAVSAPLDVPAPPEE
jgi:hypothetical protein